MNISRDIIQMKFKPVPIQSFPNDNIKKLKIYKSNLSGHKLVFFSLFLLILLFLGSIFYFKLIIGSTKRTEEINIKKAGLILETYSLTTQGGVARAVSTLANQLNKMRNLKVLVFTGIGGGEEYSLDEGIQKYSLFQSSSQEVVNLIKEFNVKYVIGNSIYDLDVQFFKNLGVKTIGLVHGFLIGSFYSNHQSYYHSFYKYKEYDLTLSLVYADKYIWDQWGFKNFLNISNGLPFELKEENLVDPKSHNVLLLGRGDDFVKGFDIAIKAMSYVIKEVPDAKLIIISPESSRNYVYKFINEVNIQNITEFYGNISDPRPFFKNKSVYLLPSLIEGCPMVLAETKSYGLPVVTNDLEFLEFAKKGAIKAEIDNAQSMANEVIKLLKNYSYRKKLGREAFDSLRDYDNSILMRNWMKILKALDNGQEVIDELINESFRNFNYEKEVANLKKYTEHTARRVKRYNCLKFENVCDLNFINNLKDC